VGALSSVRLAGIAGRTRSTNHRSLLTSKSNSCLIGDVALKDGEPVVHVHAVVGRKDGTTHGGDLLEAYIRPTCEVVLTESPRNFKKSLTPVRPRSNPGLTWN
jgi:uncharacterized protein